MKKILALCLIACLTLCLAVPAFAADASNKVGVVEGKRTWLSTFDGTDTWFFGGGAEAVEITEEDLDTVNKKNGAALSYTASGYSIVLASNLNLDLSDYVAEGVVKMDIYIEDASKLMPSVGARTAQWIGFSSNESGDTDDLKAVWVLMENMNLKTGWNEISCPISEAMAQGGTDWSKITFMRVVVGVNAEMTIKLDNLRIELPGADPIPEDAAPATTPAAPATTPAETAPATAPATTPATTPAETTPTTGGISLIAVAGLGLVAASLASKKRK